MTMIPGVGPQLARAQQGTDPRGWLVFESLPESLQRLEDSRAFADHDAQKPRGFTRMATETERALLSHLGFTVPDELVTRVRHWSNGVRNRRWPALETPGGPNTMTEMTEPGEVSQPDSPDTDTDDESLPQTLDQARKLRSENKSLRNRLHELEADHERVVTQYGAMQRRDAERVAGEVLHDGSDIWRVAPDVQQSFYDEQFGDIARDPIIAAAKKLASEKPHLAKPPAGPPPSARPVEGLRPGASPDDKPKPVTWSSALRGG